MKFRRDKHVEEAVKEVREAAAPHVALLRQVQEEQSRIDAQIKREIELLQDV
jgi:hypothetical protein